MRIVGPSSDLFRHRPVAIVPPVSGACKALGRPLTECVIHDRDAHSGYGTLFSLKHYERFRRHATFAGIYRNHAESLLVAVPQSGKDIKAQGDNRLQQTSLFRVLAGVRLHWLWAGMPAMISLGGLLLLVSAPFGWIP